MFGCSDGGCRLRFNVGQVTNGGCSCLKPLKTENKIEVERKLMMLEMAYNAYIDLINCDGDQHTFIANKDIMNQFGKAFIFYKSISKREIK